MTEPVYVLGGLQTDFARNWAREGLEIADVMRDSVLGGLERARLEARDVEVAHVGNFVRSRLPRSPQRVRRDPGTGERLSGPPRDGLEV